MSPRSNPAPGTVATYLAALPEDRRKSLKAVRALVRANLPEGYREALAHGMIVWQVPLRAYPDTYNGEPLMLAALASQKAHMSLHLMGPYLMPALDRRLRAGFRRAGLRLDMGRACVRFRSLADLAPDAIADTIAALPMERFITLARTAQRKGRR
ncbi:MAG: hypothetical protein RL721_1583 [Candidatus Eisenbacteria bacterium]|jgi:hypothetical protein